MQRWDTCNPDEPLPSAHCCQPAFPAWHGKDQTKGRLYIYILIHIYIYISIFISLYRLNRSTGHEAIVIPPFPSAVKKLRALAETFYYTQKGGITIGRVTLQSVLYLLYIKQEHKILKFDM